MSRYNGVIICDVIDGAYNRKRNNRFHTDDCELPPHERRPSEYSFRMSQSEVAATAARYGLHILRAARTSGAVPRGVYMLGRDVHFFEGV